MESKSLGDLINANNLTIKQLSQVKTLTFAIEGENSRYKPRATRNYLALKERKITAPTKEIPLLKESNDNRNAFNLLTGIKQ